MERVVGLVVGVLVLLFDLIDHQLKIKGIRDDVMIRVSGNDDTGLLVVVH